MEDEAEKKTNGQQRQDSDEQYDAGPKIKLVPKKISVKEIRVIEIYMVSTQRNGVNATQWCQRNATVSTQG